MEELEIKLKTNYDELITYIKTFEGVTMTTQLVAFNQYEYDCVRISILTFERYSALGGNRMGLSVVVMGSGEDITICLQASGASSGLFFRVNTISTSEFAHSFNSYLDKYQKEK